MSLSTAELIERGYNNRAAVPDHQDWFDRWASASAETRKRAPARLDLRYGSGPRQTLDVFPARAPRAALLFIHGGYWRSLDKSYHSFVADRFVERDVGVAVMNYDLCPQVGIAHIVDQAREAVAWLSLHGAEHGLPARRIAIAGHSAGGHLAAMMLATDWTALGVRPHAICGAAAISGVFDLEPLLLASMNGDLRLDRLAARAMSPALLSPRLAVPLVLAAGADETSEFIRQTALAWDAWPPCRPRRMSQPLYVPRRHHFSVVNDLADADSDLFRSIDRLFAEQAR
jgi:arylformamidase